MSIITKERKFLFDVNNFDLPEVPEVDPDAPPPPPVFSLEEMQQSQEEGFNQGRLTGLEEAAASRAQYISTQMEKIAHDMTGVILAEKMRENTYESEVLGLCEAIFAKAFPALNKIYGQSEILSIIRNVISTQQDKSKLIIDVPAGEKDEILAELSKMQDFDAEKVELRDTPDLQRGSCRIGWQNGGALRDHQAIADAILNELQQALAPAPQNPHNHQEDEKEPDHGRPE